MTDHDFLPCICRDDQTEGTYALGCERHEAIELSRPPRVQPSVGFHVVEYFHAEVAVATPMRMHDGIGVGVSTSYVKCDHNHETRDAADRCASRLASRIERRSAAATIVR